MAEYVNVVTSSYNDIQIFMQFPSIIWGDIKKCGLNDTCRWLIVNDAIKETVEVSMF